ncbi:MAG: hypothetical protein ACTHKV_03740 [Flavipsychrobacter sp.]
MATLKFKNADVDAKYESEFEKDPVIHIPSEKDANGRNKQNGYKGPLSAISVEQAQRLIAQKSNLVTEKKTSGSLSQPKLTT